MSLDKIPASRTLIVASRDSDSEVIGSVNIRPGERLAFALEFKGTELPAGGLLYVGDDNPFAAPSVGGADAANLTVEDSELHDTQVRFEVSLDEEATAEDEITLGFAVPLSSTEFSLLTVPVSIGS